MRWGRWVPLVCLIAVSGATPLAFADEADEPSTEVVDAEARDAAIKKGMAYLDEELWKLHERGSSPKPYAAAVAGLAYLLAAEKNGKRLPSRTKQIDRIRDYLLQRTEQVAKAYERDDERTAKERKRNRPKPPANGPPGMPGMGGLGGMGGAQYTWWLGNAALFFAESAARGKRRSASKKALRTIVLVLEASQQENGGWGHDDAKRPGMGLPAIKIPKPGGGQIEYPGTLLAASSCALAGLGAAHRALETKSASSLERGRGYYEKAQNDDGTFPYDPSQRHASGMTAGMGGGIELARTGGAFLALYLAGASPDDPVLAKAAGALDQNTEAMSEGHGSAMMALQFSALAARLRGEESWAKFRKVFFPRILEAQGEDGGFLCCCKHAAPGVTCDTKPFPGMKMPGYVESQKVYVTAIHVLILLLDRAAPESAPPIPAKQAPVTTGRGGR